MVYGLTAPLSIAAARPMPRRRPPARATLLLLLAAQTNALPKWLRWPGKTKEQKAVERVLNEFERDEFYGCIGAKPSANAAALKKAYRATAKLCHPDKNRTAARRRPSTRARRLRHPVGPRRAARVRPAAAGAAPRGEEEPEEEGTFGAERPLGKAWRPRVWVFDVWVLVKTRSWRDGASSRRRVVVLGSAMDFSTVCWEAVDRRHHRRHARADSSAWYLEEGYDVAEGPLVAHEHPRPFAVVGLVIRRRLAFI